MSTESELRTAESAETYRTSRSAGNMRLYVAYIYVYKKITDIDIFFRSVAAMWFG
jgi:hypothetical protein